ncbi:uncharacterized protein Dwil_GK22021 [Drosophila willistoni]|nr:uncharacterized protein Dwil_GK22021 [Drosophila willistoni]
MKCFLIVTSLWIVTINVNVNALVHYEKLEAGTNGCKGKSGDIEVGGTQKDPNVCGVYVCQNTEGDALIHYCQQPAAYQDCEESGVSTVMEFPMCCWHCVTYVDCRRRRRKKRQDPLSESSYLRDRIDPDEVAQYNAMKEMLCER